MQGLLKVFFPGKSGDDLDADRNLKAMKKRSTLRLLVELYFVGVIEDSGIFTNIIKDLTSVEHLKDRDTTQTNLTLLASFAKQGRVFLGLPLSGQDEEVWHSFWSFKPVFLFCFNMLSLLFGELLQFICAFLWLEVLHIVFVSISHFFDLYFDENYNALAFPCCPQLVHLYC